MLFQNQMYDFEPTLSTPTQLAQSHHWNMWKTRQWPYNVLTDATEFVMVDSWRTGGRMTWLVEIQKLVKTKYATKEQAVHIIANSLGISAPVVRRDPYTVKGPHAGYLIGWYYKPVRLLNLTRPADMKFRRQGWLEVVDASVLSRWGL